MNTYYLPNWTWRLNSLDLTKTVDVYKNLHTKTWSVRQGRVVAYTPTILIREAKFVVGEKGRQRVLRERKKYVHAFVRGYIMFPGELRDLEINRGIDKDSCCKYVEVCYNPYVYKTFVRRDNQQPIESSPYADLCINNGVLAFLEDLK